MLTIIFVCNCSKREQNAKPPNELDLIVFTYYENTAAPLKLAEAILLSLKEEPMKFEGMGRLGPNEHKEWYFSSGSGISTPLRVGDKQYALADEAILDMVGMQAYKCDFGRRIEIHLAAEFRRMDERGLDTSLMENQVKAFRLAVDTIERELQAAAR